MINNIVTALKEDRKGVITLCIESWKMEPRAVTPRVRISCFSFITGGYSLEISLLYHL